jgi:hypothetical protein
MMFTGHGVTMFQLAALKAALGFEIKCPGMRMTRGASAYSTVKRLTGLKGNKQKVYDAFCVIVAAEAAKLQPGDIRV